MTFDGPGGLFDGLDDPTPPSYGGELLGGVVLRGQQLRRQRRLAYGIGSACVVVLIVGAAVGVAGTGGGNNHPVTPASPSATAHSTRTPHHPTHSPTTSHGGAPGSGHGQGTGTPPPACVTPTPTDVPTSPTPTGTDSPSPTPTDTPTDGSPTATPTPTGTSCPTATPTDTPTSEPTDSPSASDPPLLPGL